MIFFIFLEVAGHFHIDINIYSVYIIHIYTTPAFLHLHFLSPHWVVTFDFTKSFVRVMSFHLQLNFLPSITKKWWYCRCRLFKRSVCVIRRPTPGPHIRPSACEPHKNFNLLVLYLTTCFKETALLFNVHLKLVSAIFYQIFIFWSNDRPLKTMKNVFYFIWKAFFVFEIFKVL